MYVNMRKAGSSAVTELLSEYYGALICGTASIESPYRPARDRNGRQLVMGSHRNPWDHYVSLWAFGVGGACCVDVSVAKAPARSLSLISWPKLLIPYDRYRKWRIEAQCVAIRAALRQKDRRRSDVP